MFEQVNNNTTTSNQQQDIFLLSLRPCGPAGALRPCGPAAPPAPALAPPAPALALASFHPWRRPLVDVSKQQRPAPGGRPLELKFLVDQV